MSHNEDTTDSQRPLVDCVSMMKAWFRKTASTLGLTDSWLLLLMVIAIVLRVVFWLYTDRVWEDCLITTLHAENFYSGLGLTHFKIDDPKPLHGFTSPISVLIPLLADRFFTGGGIWLQKLLSLVGGPVTVWFGYRILREYLVPQNRACAVLGAGYLAVEHHQILWGMAGMESQLATAILLSSIYFLIAGNNKWCAFTCGLCLLARPDFVVWVAIAAVAIVVNTPRSGMTAAMGKFCIRVALIYGPWLLFTVLYYGSPVPNTIIAKRLGYIGFWETASSVPTLIADALIVLVTRVCVALEPTFGGNGTGFIPLIHGYWMVVGCLLVALYGFFVDVDRRSWSAMPLYVFSAGFALFLDLSAPIVFGWYTVPLCATLVLLVAKGIADLCGILPRRLGIVSPWIFTAVYLSSFTLVLPTTFKAERNIQRLVEQKVRIPIGVYLSHTPPTTTIAGEPLGYIGYYSRRTYYDYPGLCSRKVVGWLAEHKYPRAWKELELFAYLHPDYLVLRRVEYYNFLAEPAGAFLKKNYHIDREFSVPAEDQKKLFHKEANVDLDYLILLKNNG